MSQQKFEEEMAKLGVKPGGGRMTPPAMVRDFADGVAYANGLTRAHRDSEGFALGTENSVIAIAERVLRDHGVVGRGNSADLIIRALTTTDFAQVLTAIGETLVVSSYELQPVAHRMFARESTATNFAPQQRAIVSAGGALEQVPEGGVIAERRIATEAAPSYSLKTYAGILSFSRMLLLNNNLAIMAEAARQRGVAAAETERKAVWGDLLLPNAGSFFSAGKGNSASAAAGATVSATTLGLARAALRAQVAPDGTQVGSRLAYIVAGPATENAWEALLSARRLPSEPADGAGLMNPKVLIEPSIIDESWFGFADYRLGTTAVEYAYLHGNGVRLERQPGWESEGVSLKVALDFGAGLIDFRGAFRMQQAA